jgi:hypothetical protein
VLLDHLVRGLAPDAGPHRRHEHGRGREEGQVAVQLTGDHGRVGTELVEHREGGLVQPVGREERDYEIRRRLKRAISRSLFRLMQRALTPAQTTTSTGPHERHVA